ncbi:DUF4142 domain-containing protein [Pedomonas sp. V897]|uniref:DUF4142 domain-containing protein n=1 Tax=Pedomonas sp. V897 TaxID=3446482 RepID=UPI003EE22971
MMKWVTSIAVIAACLAPAWQAAAGQGSGGEHQSLALAQSGGQAPGTTATPTSPGPPASGATPADLSNGTAPVSAATFIEKARAGNRFEVESSQMAEEKATQPSLKSFGRMMIKDHTTADQRLAKLASDLGHPRTTQVQLEPRQQRQLESLASASGGAFDQLYAQAQLEAHQMAVQLYQSYAKSGTDQRLRQFAEETLPVLQGHLKQIEAMTQ